MRDLLILTIHLIVTVAQRLRLGGVRALAAESVSLKHQLIVSNRVRLRAPDLTMLDRFLIVLTALFIDPRRIPKCAGLFQPAPFFKFHRIRVDRKYRLLFSCAARKRKPGPQGPSPERIAALVESKHRNPNVGCVRIAQQIHFCFDLGIDKDGVPPVLAKHYRPGRSGFDGPSWLTFLAHAKDRLWRLDLFRCESIQFPRYGVLVVIDVFSAGAWSASVSSVHRSMACPIAEC